MIQTSRYIAVALIMICLMSTAAPTNALSLTTKFDGGVAGGGIYFNLTAKSQPVLVTHFDINFRVNATVEVFSKQGSHVGFEQTPSAWTSRGSMLINGVENTPTMLETQDIIIPANQTVGIYMSASDSAGFGYSFGVALGETFDNEDLSLFTVTSHSGDTGFAGSLFSPRTWNGTVYYQIFEEQTCYSIKTQNGNVTVFCL